MRKTSLALICGFALTGASFAQQAPQAAPAARVQPSPSGSAATQVLGKWEAEKPGAEPRYKDGKWITVTYSRPILKGRQNIFGSGTEYGKKVSGGQPVWRTGANATTRLKTEASLVVAGKTLPAGEYSLFVELKEGAWTLVVSNQRALEKYDPKDKSGTWGADNYDPKFDLVRAPMKLTKGTDALDQFTIQFVNMTQQGGTLALCWDKEIATVDFKAGS